MFLAALFNFLANAFHFITCEIFLEPSQNPKNMSQKPKHIVTIGGSFASVRTAHKFLQGMQNKSAGPYKVTMISRDSHFFWNLAMPRAIIPGTIPEDKLFQAIAPGFAKYGDKFELIVATATGIDISNKQVKVYKAGQETFISYDYLLIGTGSSTKAESPFKSRGSTDATREYVHAYQKRVGEAQSIIVAGAGPTGVEVAGELADYYGNKKEISLVRKSSTQAPIKLTPCIDQCWAKCPR